MALAVTHSTILPRPGRIWFWWLAAGLVGGCIAFVVFMNFRNAALELTDERLAQARLKWKQAGRLDYDIEVGVSGATSGTYAVQVRGGKIKSATQNGKPLDEQRAAFWTMDGLLTVVLAGELENARKPGAPSCYSQAQFDPQDGHLVEYLHTINGRTTKMVVTVKPPG